MKLAYMTLGCSALIACTASTGDDSATSSSNAGALLDGTPRADAVLDCKETAAREGITSVTLKGKAVDWPNGVGLSGVEFCAEAIDGTGSVCATTSASGRASLTVEPCQDLRVSFHAAGYLHVNRLERIQTTELFAGTYMLTTAQASQTATSVGQTYDPAKALPIFTTLNGSLSPLSGVTITLTPASGVPWYFSMQGQPSAALSATTLKGLMGITNVDAGASVTATATIPGKTCTPMQVQGDGGPNTAIVEMVPNSIAEVIFVCQ